MSRLIPVSILILTFNERMNLENLLPLVKELSDDIVVLDSKSTDGTAEYAVEMGCRVFSRAFDNEKAQRQFGNALPFKHEWVYNPDADEMPTPELIREIAETVSRESAHVAYEVRFKNMFCGKWIRRSTDYPVWVVRLFRPKFLDFDREVNLHYAVDGAIGRLQAHFIHFPFSKGIEWWIDKHNRYSSAEAREAQRVIRRSVHEAIWHVIGSRSAKERRIALKELSFALPGRGTLRFLYSYFFRAGFLDGLPGLRYCILISHYEFLISLKLEEIQQRAASWAESH